MKRATIIRIINGTESLRRDMYERFAPFVPAAFSKDLYVGGRLDLPMEENSNELTNALKYAHEKNLSPKLFSCVYYSNGELDKIPFFEMRLLSPLEKEGTSALDYGTAYENECPICHLGGTPLADVCVDRKFIRPNASIGHLLPDIFVSDEVKNLIVAHGLTGVTFQHKVIDWKKRELKPISVMSVHNRLPPMHETVWKDNESICAMCGRRSFFIRSEIRYKEADLQNTMDFNITQEYLDAWKIPAIIVSAKVRKCFIKNKVRAGFIPITILAGK